MAKTGLELVRYGEFLELELNSSTLLLNSKSQIHGHISSSSEIQALLYGVCRAGPLSQGHTDRE